MPTVSTRRVVITGMGAISPQGVGAAALWQGLREGRSAIGPLRHAGRRAPAREGRRPGTGGLRPAAHIDERILPLLDRTSRIRAASPRARRWRNPAWISRVTGWACAPR